MRGLIGEEVKTASLGRDIPSTGVGAEIGGQTLRVTGRRQNAIERDVGLRGDQVSYPLVADLQPVNLLETARAVREEALSRVRLGSIGERAFFLPRLTVCLSGHVRQRVEPVLGAQLDLVDRLVARAL